ncbi:aminotransferase class III-fold pyridoxal phosphate-dependent enzyme [Parasphingorhabdus sp.]|uniref:aminotransferase class III-fold pyridoxal phosphate-dependent enzyme n=1 Tax=Parasphingorhabdus sp. TaxID=2709688 RepID=UPI003265CB35
MSGANDQALRARAERVIPAGMYGHQSTNFLPPNAPQFFAKAKGSYLWDYDDKKYLDFMSGYGPNLFGYCNDEVDTAYKEQMDRIDVATGPTGLMVELAEAFCNRVTHADWAAFCKNGTDATSMALMTARAHADKRKVLIASGAYHGAANWCTPFPSGTLPEERAHFIYYQYNDAESLHAAAAEAGDDLAGIFASPFKHDVLVDQELPDLEYAKAAREICNEKNALLIVDDIRGGFRIERDCSWHAMGIEPDLSSWGKAIANGHPLSCLLGSERAREAFKKLYVTGSFWFSGAVMAASLKTLELIDSTDYLEHTIMLGDQLRSGLSKVAANYELNISQTGPSQMPLIMFNDDEGNRDMTIGGAFADGMIKRGVYFHPFHNMFINAAMTEKDIALAVETADEVVKDIRSA